MGNMLFNPECTRNHFSAGLYPDPLRELRALPRHSSWIWGGVPRTGQEHKGVGVNGVRKEGRMEGEGTRFCTGSYLLFFLVPFLVVLW